MYFEIYRSGNLIKRGDEILDDSLEWDNELMYVPSLEITLPIYYHDYITGHDEIKVFANDKCYWGIVQGLQEDKKEEVLIVDLEHVVNEWTYRQISVNNAIKDGNINFIYKGSKIVSLNGKNISASPFDMYTNEVSDMTREKYIMRAGASAWTDDGEKLPITKVTSDAEAKPGTFHVEFASDSISVVVTATVKKPEGAKQSTKNNVTVSAVPFEISIDEVGKLTDADYIKRACATAWRS